LELAARLPGWDQKEPIMPKRRQTTSSRRPTKTGRIAPAKTRKSPARGKPGSPKGAKSTAALRTPRSKAAAAGRGSNQRRKKSG
jgi:hypothetical protein